MNEIKDKLSLWSQDNIDFALFLAVFTETPRWTVVFVAVHESVFIGIPLGVLLAFATSRAWRTYFETRDRNLFVLNIASMVIAVLVIAPVLFAMTQVEANDVQIASVLNIWLVWCWAFLLALTTFIPLGQLAFVQGIEQTRTDKPNIKHTKRVTRTVRATQTLEASEQFDEQPEQYAIVQGEQLPTNSEQSVEQLPVLLTEQPIEIDLSSLTPEQKRMYAQDSYRNNPRLNKSALSKQLQVGRTTLYEWINEVSLQSN